MDKTENLEQIETPLQAEQLKQDLEKSGVTLNDYAKRIRIAPSKRVILQMPKDILIKHNALIFHKGSSLSSAQRNLVQNRIAYGINKGMIKPEEVASEINKLNALIQGELLKQIEDADNTL